MDGSRRIETNLAAVRERIERAATQAGRSSDAITLVAVTKYVGVAAASALVQAGCGELGESRPQQLWTKAAAMASLPVHWHLVGHLQRNKLGRVAQQASWIHSGDRWSLLSELDQWLLERGQVGPSVLLEVNISAEPGKHGFAPDDLRTLLPKLLELKASRIRGLMAMSGRDADADTARRQFAAVRELRDQLQREAGEQLRLDELSMGMSGDLEAAIREGATLVRVGSALFEGLSDAEKD